MQHLLRGTDLEHPRRLFLTWQVEVADLGACVQLHCYSASSSVKRKSEMKLDCSSNFFFPLEGWFLGILATQVFKSYTFPLCLICSFSQ